MQQIFCTHSQFWFNSVRCACLCDVYRTLRVRITSGRCSALEVSCSSVPLESTLPLFTISTCVHSCRAFCRVMPVSSLSSSWLTLYYFIKCHKYKNEQNWSVMSAYTIQLQSVFYWCANISSGEESWSAVSRFERRSCQVSVRPGFQLHNHLRRQAYFMYFSSQYTK